MRSWEGELRDSGSEPEGDTNARDEERRREATAGGEDGGSKRIYARQ